MSRDINLSLIDTDPTNARKHFEESAIAELAQSIGASSLAVPILVRPVGDRFMIVHGERRYRAVKSLGWDTIPADVRELEADAASWLALAENVQRADLSPIEEAQAYQVKLATGITQTDMGAHIGKTQSYIAHKLRLLTLPAYVQAALANCTISEGHARQLLRLKTDEARTMMCEKAITQGLPVAELSKLVDDWLELDRLEAIIQKGLDNLDELRLTLDSKAYPLTPAQFGHWVQTGHGETDLTQIVSTMYANCFYRVKGNELSIRLDFARTVPEIQTIISEADEALRDLGEYHIRAERRAGEILSSMSRDIIDTL